MDKDSSFANTLYKHCKEIIKLAEMKKSWFDISAITQSKPFYLEYEHAKKYWKEKNESAKNLMQQRGSVYDSILIEVAAQHPLKRNDEPNREFKQRLDIAVELYFKYKKLGAGVNIYVPGSIHKKDGVCDNISLSSAGVQYLKDKKNIPQEDLFGDDMNQKYKGEAGVYNSADECFVAAQIFKNGDYDHLFCVCSPNQVTRKTLFYLDFGVYPQCYSVPCDNMFHDIVYELFDNIKYVLYSNDHSWQDENSEPYKNSRLERKP